MVVKVALAKDDDIPRLFEIAALAFGRNEALWDILFPAHWTPEGRQHGVDRMLLQKQTDPNASFIKAYDDATNEILGFSKWYTYQDSFPREDLPSTGVNYWKTAEEQQWMTKVVDALLIDRRAAIERTKGNLVALDLLAVDPAHQRKKVGDAMVRWGVEHADSLGLEACVESSKPGRGLYEKHGFVFQRDNTITPPAPYLDRDCGGVAWLVRPKKLAQV